MQRFIACFYGVIFLLCIWHFVALASQPVTRFSHLSIEHGLSQNAVYTIVQDHRGFLWFGTQDGLNRYDGYQFKVFRHNPRDPTSLADNDVQVLYVDWQGRLWVGSYASGLSLFDAATESFTHYKQDFTNPHSISSNNVRAIVQTQKNKLWIATYGGGLNILDTKTGQFEHFRHNPAQPQSLTNNNIVALHVNHQGLWLGVEGGGLSLFDMHSQSFSHFRHDANDATSLSSDWVQAITTDQYNHLWIGTRDGLNRLDGRRFERFYHQGDWRNSISHNDIHALFRDAQNNLWIGTNGGGVNRYHELLGFSRYEHNSADANSLSNDFIQAIYQDKHGSVWFATYAGGASRVNLTGPNFSHYRHDPTDANSLSYSGVRAFLIDNQQRLWVGTDKGLNRSSKSGFTRYWHQANNPNSLSHNYVRAIVQSDDNTLWFGTDGGGLNRYDVNSDSFEHFRHDVNDLNSLSDDEVMNILFDSKGQLWVGTWGGGLNRYRAESRDFYRYKHNPMYVESLSSNDVTSIFESKDGTIWVGTFDGLNRYHHQSNSFTSYQYIESDPNSLSNNSIYSIAEDKQGVLWLGTGGGLERFDPIKEQFRHFGVREGLANEMIYGVLVDDEGIIWLSTNHGLSRFDPFRRSFKNYNEQDGLQSNEFNGGAYYKSHGGELFFGGINGFNRFFPHDVQDDRTVPHVVLTDLLIFNQSVKVSTQFEKEERYILPKVIEHMDRIELSYKHNLIAFEFAALHLIDPKQNQYAYKLEGQDERWVKTSANNRRATYTNLDSGVYTLTIKASNKDGYWNEQGKSLQIYVSPPPWQTWWAYSLYLLLACVPIGLFIVLQRQKINSEHALNLQLEQMVSDRTQQLQQKNQEILDTQQQLVQSEKMASLGTLTAGIAHEINNPNNFVKVSSKLLETDLQDFQQHLNELVEDESDRQIVAGFNKFFDGFYSHINIIFGGTQRIKSIVEDLNTFTAFDGDEKREIVITDLLLSLVHLVEVKYVHVIEFTTDFTATPKIDCNPAQLNQVFMNLIVNACHAIEAGMGDRPAKGQIIVGCHQNHQYIEVTVKDNGCGMSDKTKAKLFEPFYTTKDVGQGTGLGLSISYGVVQQHGGQIEVESQLGLGSMFKVVLPVTSTEELAPI